MKQNENGKKIKENIRNQMRRIGSWKSWSKRRKLTTGVCGVCVIAVVAGAIGLSDGSDTEVIYKETTVKYGTLVLRAVQQADAGLALCQQAAPHRLAAGDAGADALGQQFLRRLLR